MIIIYPPWNIIYIYIHFLERSIYTSRGFIQVRSSRTEYIYIHQEGSFRFYNGEYIKGYSMYSSRANCMSRITLYTLIEQILYPVSMYTLPERIQYQRSLQILFQSVLNISGYSIYSPRAYLISRIALYTLPERI